MTQAHCLICFTSVLSSNINYFPTSLVHFMLNSIVVLSIEYYSLWMAPKQEPLFEVTVVYVHFSLGRHMAQFKVGMS